MHIYFDINNKTVRSGRKGVSGMIVIRLVVAVQCVRGFRNSWDRETDNGTEEGPYLPKRPE